MAATPSPNGVYWIGQDGQTYIKTANGVQSGNGGVVTNGLKQIADPNAPPGHVLGASTAAPNPAASYDQGIANTQAAIDRLSGQQTANNATIDAQTKDALNKLLLGRNQSQQTYDQNKQQTGQDFVSAKNTIGSNAGTSLAGLEHLLGSRGAGGSSAATIAAPDAVAHAATLQRNDATHTFGQNEQNLDTNFNTYLQGYNNDVNSVNGQADQQKQQNANTIASNRASLLQSLGTLFGQKAAAAGGNGTGAAQPYIDEANTLLNHVANYSAQPLNYNTTPYTPPALSSYTATPNAAATPGTTAGSDYTAPFLSALLGKKQAQPA